jgi:hypothetical protein
VSSPSRHTRSCGRLTLPVCPWRRPDSLDTAGPIFRTSARACPITDPRFDGTAGTTTVTHVPAAWLSRRSVAPMCAARSRMLVRPKRQTVPGEPDVVAVLGDESGRLEAMGLRRVEKEQEPQQHPVNPRRRACGRFHPGLGLPIRAERVLESVKKVYADRSDVVRRRGPPTPQA